MHRNNHTAYKKKIFRYSAGFTLTQNTIKMLITYYAPQHKITTKQAIAKIQETGLLSAHDKMMKEWVDIKCACCNKNAQ